MAAFLVAAAVVLLIGMAGMYVVYDFCFSGNKRYMGKETDLPQGEQYECYHDMLRNCVEQVIAEPCEEVSVYSHDGLKLMGRYYHRREGAPLIIFFHGYRSNARRDGIGICIFSKGLGYNVLLVDQRTHGMSEGKSITFGIKERYDCFSWVDWALQRFGEEQRIVLSGLSMGAATVLMAADMGLPKNVKGIMADCPFSSPKEVIRKVIRDMRYPVEPVYWLAKQGARLFGGFDLEETSALEAIAGSKLPILIIHGGDDRFVPCNMSKECKRIANDHVELLVVEGAGHGLCYCVDAKRYEKAVLEFLRKTVGEM